MKNYLIYGLGMAVAGFLVQLVLFILGFHSDAAKFGEGQWIGGAAGLAVSVVAIVLGTKAQRALLPESSGFSYGQAVGAGVMICLFSAILGTILNYIYVNVINPQFTDIVVQYQLAKAQAKGLDADQLAQMEKGIRFMSGPVFGTVIWFIVGMFFGTIVSLITGAFLKRPAPDQAASA
jgi:hypothetical protein